MDLLGRKDIDKFLGLDDRGMATFVVDGAMLDGRIGVFLELDGLEGDGCGTEKFGFVVVLEVLEALPLGLFLDVHE